MDYQQCRALMERVKDSIQFYSVELVSDKEHEDVYLQLIHSAQKDLKLLIKIKDGLKKTTRTNQDSTRTS